MKSDARKALLAYLDYALDRPGRLPQNRDSIGLRPILAGALFAAAVIAWLFMLLAPEL